MSVVDAMVAEVSEPSTLAVEFRGLKLSIPASMEEWPIEVMEAFEQEQYVATCRELLGPAQWAAIKTLRLKVKDLHELVEACFSGVGVDTKNSES